jgi:hypothetical protein
MIEVADAVASPPRGALARLWVWPVVLMRVHIARWRLLANARRLIEQDDQRRGGNRHTRRQRLSGVRALVDLHFSNVTSAARLAFFERVFAMWHLMHLPLFLLMVLAVVAHVVAVHLY